MEMMKFLRRLIKKKNRKVCYDAGLAGLTWWYDCTNPEWGKELVDKNADWISLNAAIFDKKGNAVAGKCPWIRKKRETCPPRDTDCPGDASASFPDCKGQVKPRRQ